MQKSQNRRYHRKSIGLSRTNKSHHSSHSKYHSIKHSFSVRTHNPSTASFSTDIPKQYSHRRMPRPKPASTVVTTSYGAHTDPSTGDMNVPGYEGVNINPSLLLSASDRAHHIEKSWELYRDKMHSPQSICAPMVEQSELPFRLLVRKYGCDSAVTPMLNPNVIHTDESLSRRFETCAQDTPLTIQICGPDLDQNIRFLNMIEPFHPTDINLNLGCPQGIAKRGRYGSFLLEDTTHVQRIVFLIRQHFPEMAVSVKMRILLNDPDHQRTINFARALQDTGASMVTLHARRRNNKQDLLGQADLIAIRRLKQAMDIPVAANGAVGCYMDFFRVKEYTGADAVMVSEGLLCYPTMFAYPIRRSQLLHANERPFYEEGCYLDAEKLEPILARVHHGYPQYFNSNADTVIPPTALPATPFNMQQQALLDDKIRHISQQSSSVESPQPPVIDSSPTPHSVTTSIMSPTQYLEQHIPANFVDVRTLIQKHLSPELASIPMLHSLSPITDLITIDQRTGPDPVSVAAELIQITSQHHESWFACQRPHLFKILQRELQLFTDLRFIYSTRSPVAALEVPVLQLLRLQQLGCWFIFQQFSYHKLSQFLNKHQLTHGDSQSLSEDEQNIQIIQALEKQIYIDPSTLDTSNLSQQQLANILQSFPFERLVQGVDVVAHLLTNSESSSPDISESTPNQTNLGHFDDPHTRNAAMKRVETTPPQHEVSFVALWRTLNPGLDFITIGTKAKTNKQFPVNSFFEDNNQWFSFYRQQLEKLGLIERQEQSVNAEDNTDAIHFAKTTPHGTNLNYNSENAWIPRQPFDQSFARVFKLNSPDATSQSSPSVTQDVDLRRFILALPLESSWFFERLLTANNDWYYRYHHHPHPYVVPIDPNSIQDQLNNMRKAPMKNPQNAIQPYQTHEDHQRNKALKEQFRKEQRIREQEVLQRRKPTSESSVTTSVEQQQQYEESQVDGCAGGACDIDVPGSPVRRPRESSPAVAHDVNNSPVLAVEKRPKH